MRIFEKTFQNEWQNRVTLALEHTPHVDQPGQLTIILAGPYSVAENTVTVMEARELQAALTAALRYRGVIG